MIILILLIGWYYYISQYVFDSWVGVIFQNWQCLIVQLELKKQFLTNKKEAVERNIKEKKDQNEQRRKAELGFIKYQNSHLESYQKQVNQNKG